MRLKKAQNTETQKEIQWLEDHFVDYLAHTLTSEETLFASLILKKHFIDKNQPVTGNMLVEAEAANYINQHYYRVERRVIEDSEPFYILTENLILKEDGNIVEKNYRDLEYFEKNEDVIDTQLEKL